ncbi:MAG: PilZ domain-containing protein [Erythrobacter sp.]|nr:PilZ domain-containing protein [Erythrobacter sp.]MDZ4274274.1 PilZ domain-containing protein [Erythrobacter sp.]
MNKSRSLDPATGASNRRYAPRYAVRLPATGTDAASSFDACVNSISSTGMSIQAPIELKVGDVIEIDLPSAGLTSATVIWSDGAVGGCKFVTPLERSVLSSIRLNSYPTSDSMNGCASAVELVDADRRWAGSTRLALIISAALAAWSLVVTAFLLVS